jgi:uncharacterized membrane protein
LNKNISQILIKCLIFIFIFASCVKSTKGVEISELQKEVESIISLILKQDINGLEKKLPDKLDIEVGYNLFIKKFEVVNDLKNRKFIYAYLFNINLYQSLSHNESASVLMSIKDQLVFYNNIKIKEIKLVQEKPIYIYRVLLTWPDRGENVNAPFDKIDFYNVDNKWLLRSLFFESY